MAKRMPPTKARLPFDPGNERCGFANDGAWASRNIDGKNLDMRVLSTACGKPYEKIAGIRRGFEPITSDIRPILEREFGEEYDPHALAKWQQDNHQSEPTSSSREDILVQLILKLVPMLSAHQQIALKRGLDSI